MDPVWDFETLLAWFAARPGEDVPETDLLRAFFPAEDVFAGGADLNLFTKHFLLYRRLWLFDDELRLATGQRLWIRGIRSTLVDPPPPGRCGWLDPETGRYCLVACGDRPHCDGHSGSVPASNGMKGYYLDWANLEGMTEEGVRDLVEGFFRWMGNRGAVAGALEAFGLPQDADGRTIKARWRQLSLEHHPDRGGDPAFYQRLSAAWAVLKSPG
jgi:hypothetical protein